MNYQNFVFYDFETTGVNPQTCQPIQLASIIIDGRKLEIKPDSLFSSYIKPIFDVEECEKLGLTPLGDEVLKITNIKLEDLENAPSLENVWNQFQQYVNKYNAGKSKWTAPIKAGMNIDKYDNIIVDRICGGHITRFKKSLDLLTSVGIVKKNGIRQLSNFEPYGFGPWDDKRGEETLFFPRDSIDLMRILWMWTENIKEVRSLSMDAIREWLNISTEGAHNAAKDVQDGANLLIRFLKLHRHFVTKIKFK